MNCIRTFERTNICEINNKYYYDIAGGIYECTGEFEFPILTLYVSFNKSVKFLPEGNRTYYKVIAFEEKTVHVRNLN